ncbi:MAG: hypothetical protein IJD48_04260 [Clostridia bacterium]|nr:hypothetical protein [Clostridia bacterium]
MEDILLTTQIMHQFELEEVSDCSFRAIVLLVQNSRLKNGAHEPIMGRSMKDWLAKSLDNFDVTFVDYNLKDDVFDVIKPYLGKEDYTIVLYSDTPLIKNTTVYDIVEYVQTKAVDFCKLPRGFVVKTSAAHIKNFVLSAEPNFIETEDFFNVFDNVTLAKAKQIIKDRIIEKHLKNQVIIDDKNTVFIDADVQIENGVKIAPFNTIKGKTNIAKNVVLNEYNLIENCNIGQNSTLVFCHLKDYNVDDNSNLGHFISQKFAE